jgi:hypothetical protein
MEAKEIEAGVLPEISQFRPVPVTNLRQAELYLSV